MSIAGMFVWAWGHSTRGGPQTGASLPGSAVCDGRERWMVLAMEIGTHGSIARHHFVTILPLANLTPVPVALFPPLVTSSSTFCFLIRAILCPTAGAWWPSSFWIQVQGHHSWFPQFQRFVQLSIHPSVHPSITTRLDLSLLAAALRIDQVMLLDSKRITIRVHACIEPGHMTLRLGLLDTLAGCFPRHRRRILRGSTRCN